ncbi:MAG: DUF4157 domain-containing protein [Deltaproteobacteria bacterium]|nr:DUF4157 domain-containing protein [Deltaproteobacteria bacterium]MBZ0219714.1 DUF4157 domain-containing protein [Deltaproteobacteria bacterium]
MKAGAEKSSKTTSTAAPASNLPFFKKAGAGDFLTVPKPTPANSIQPKLAVNKPGDKFEQEADRMADKAMRSPGPALSSKEELQERQSRDGLQKKEEKKEKAPRDSESIQRAGSGDAPVVTAGTQSEIQSKTSEGQPLSSGVRQDMEPRFNANFGRVRIHTDSDAAGLSSRLGARAFTYRNHIFFSRDQYQPGSSEGRRLLAHELTHTIQQGHAVQRSPEVTSTSSAPAVQRWGKQDALDKVSEWAFNIPGFRLLTLLLGFNPVNNRGTERNAAGLLRALIEVLPGGASISQALDNHGAINKAAVWVEQRMAVFGNIGIEITHGLRSFIGTLKWSDILDLGGVWERAKVIFTGPISRLIAFGSSVVIDILKMVKDAILKPLASMAHGTRGYDLLKAVLGEDPITGEAVPRNPESLIGGFLKLIGREDLWENIKKGNAVAMAWAWFQGSLAGLMGFVRAIPRKILDAVAALTFQDLITVSGAFGKIAGAFANIVTEFVSWGVKQVFSLLDILFSVVAPGVRPYIKKTQAAFLTILKNPITFAWNLVRAGRLGFERFAGKIVEHLKTALIKWLAGPLAEAGAYIPKSFSLPEIFKLMLSVLGVTWRSIRAKLVKTIPDPVLASMEKTADILVALIKNGPVALWERMRAELSELKGELIAKVTSMVSSEIVKAAVLKLAAILSPAGAVIQAIMSIHSTISFFVQKISQIAAVVGSFIESISEIAAGQVDSAAQKVEQTITRTLTLVLAFLAKFAGLDGIPDKVIGIARKIRQPVEKAMDKAVGWLGNTLKKIGSSVKEASVSLFQWWKKKITIDAGDEKHCFYFQGEEDYAEPMVASNPKRLEDFIKEAFSNEMITGNTKKMKALNRIKSKPEFLREKLRKLRQAKNASDKKAVAGLLQDIDNSNNEIGKYLGIVLAGFKSGTRNNRISLPWHKPAYNEYPPLYLYHNAKQPDGNKWRITSKKKIRGVGKLVWQLNPDGVHKEEGAPNEKVPQEIKKIGIMGNFRVIDGHEVGPLSQEETKGGKELRDRLVKYGWNGKDMDGKDMDCDHVLEIQVGGEDELQNLWPLKSSKNRSAGPRLSKEKVMLDGQIVTIDWLKKVKQPDGTPRKFFFKVALK